MDTFQVTILFSHVEIIKVVVWTSVRCEFSEIYRMGTQNYGQSVTRLTILWEKRGKHLLHGPIIKV